MSVSVLIDTNIVIKREDSNVLDEDLQKLMNTLWIGFSNVYSWKFI